MILGNQTCAKWRISGFYITGKEVHFDAYNWGEQSHLLYVILQKVFCEIIKLNEIRDKLQSM